MFLSAALFFPLISKMGDPRTPDELCHEVSIWSPYGPYAPYNPPADLYRNSDPNHNSRRFTTRFDVEDGRSRDGHHPDPSVDLEKEAQAREALGYRA